VDDPYRTAGGRSSAQRPGGFVHSDFHVHWSLFRSAECAGRHVPIADITESWLFATLPLSLSAGDKPTDSYTWDNVLTFADPFFIIISLEIFDNTTGDFTANSAEFIGSPQGFVEDTGVLTFTPVATPEPSSLVLMLAGVGLVFVMRKPIGQRLPQVS
jgi:hypothetical protein